MSNPSESETGTCHRCGETTSERDRLNPWDHTKREPRFECYWCRKHRERTYDDFVDPMHAYH